jgi:hypothetical protein
MPIFIQDGWKRVPFSINGFCYYVPSNKLLEELIGQVDIESQRLFQIHSNFLVQSICHEGSFLSPQREIEKALCIHLGDSWDDWQRHMAVVDYCKGVLPQRINSPQKAINAADAVSSVFKQAIEAGTITLIRQAFPVQRDPSEIPIENPRTLELCRRSAEFKNSHDYQHSFMDRLLTERMENPTINSLVLQYVQALKDRALDGRRLPPVTGQELLRVCPYCGKFFEMIRGKSGKPKPHCGAVRCRQEYDRCKPSRTSKRATPIGWVKAHSRKPCKGTCVSERVDLNSDWLCRRCSQKR